MRRARRRRRGLAPPGAATTTHSTRHANTCERRTRRPMPPGRPMPTPRRARLWRRNKRRCVELGRLRARRLAPLPNRLSVVHAPRPPKQEASPGDCWTKRLRRPKRRRGRRTDASSEAAAPPSSWSYANVEGDERCDVGDTGRAVRTRSRKDGRARDRAAGFARGRRSTVRAGPCQAALAGTSSAA